MASERSVLLLCSANKWLSSVRIIIYQSLLNNVLRAKVQNHAILSALINADFPIYMVKKYRIIK